MSEQDFQWLFICNDCDDGVLFENDKGKFRGRCINEDCGNTTEWIDNQEDCEIQASVWSNAKKILI